MQPILIAAAASSLATNFCGEPFSIWAPSHVAVLDNGQQLQLELDETSGGGFASRNKFVYGNFEVQMKVAQGNTAGTVTAFYLSTATQNRDELDFEFLGNVSGQPYLLQTNIFLNGTGYREQRISLWFDPTTDFHTYSMSWTKQQVIFSVDGVPIRTFANNEESAMLYVDKPMGVFFSIWNGDDWATEGGLVKINWTAAPFVANYQNFRKDGACLYTGNTASSCSQNRQAFSQATVVDLSRLNWLQSNFMTYDYCTDSARFPVTPSECNSV